MIFDFPTCSRNLLGDPATDQLIAGKIRLPQTEESHGKEQNEESGCLGDEKLGQIIKLACQKSAEEKLFQ